MPTITAAPAASADFTVLRDGSVVLFNPRTRKAVRKAARLGLESWQWIGGRFVVDVRYAQDLAARLSGEGFTFADEED